jgi:tellurite resistance protein TerC
MEVHWYWYAAFLAFVIAMLIVDLRAFHSEEHEPSMKESGMWSVIWIGLGVLFGVGLWVWQGGTVAGEYFAGYLIEKALSVDNMFVFVVIFSYFSIPRSKQHQVLFYGILGALVFRGLFIAAGVALIHNFEWIIYVFGAFLIYTAWRIAKGEAEEIHPENNKVLQFFQRRFRTTTKFDGQKLFTIENGKRVGTPLFITLIFIEFTDILFAIDSIPAIFGVTDDAFIILTSNVFAILGLRALYFLLAGAVSRLHLLRYGLGIILAFVGIKMLLGAVDVHVPIWASLTFITIVLAATTWLSLKIPPPEDKEALAKAKKAVVDADSEDVRPTPPDSEDEEAFDKAEKAVVDAESEDVRPTPPDSETAPTARE